MLTISAFVTGFGYVVVTNRTAAHGFELGALEQHVAELKASNEKLQLQAADLRALSVADAAGKALDLQPADSFDVLPTTTGSVAIRNP